MSIFSEAASLTDWQRLNAKDPAGAARELSRRLHTRLTPAQQRAVFSWIPDERQLIAAMEGVAGTLAPLAGVPYALKDVFHLAGVPTRGGANFPPGIIPQSARDGKLPHILRGIGAIAAGKTQLYEFAYGLTGENPHHGDCEHPGFPGRTSGGSSSGSAAAVAANIVPMAIGTDTGGSIRVPAAFCGLYGYRTGTGHPWTGDILPLAPGFDTPGWFTAHAEDMATLNAFLLGKASTTREPRGCYLDFSDLGQSADPDVATALIHAADVFAPRADELTAQQFAHGFHGAADAYAVLQSTEAFQVHSDWLDVHREHYDPAVWTRIDRGRRWTTDQLDAAHTKRAALKLLWTNFFLTYDFLVMPATPFPALRKAECTAENRNRLLTLTTPASMGGLPVLTIPIALPSGLSSGLQIVLNSDQSPVVPWALARAAQFTRTFRPV